MFIQDFFFFKSHGGGGVHFVAGKISQIGFSTYSRFKTKSDVSNNTVKG